MPKKLLHGIDITAPGGIEKLMSFHRAMFGDAVMEADPDASTAPAGEPNTDPAPKAEEFKAPASQEELDRIIQGRLDRERKRFGDYDDLKARAARLDEIEEANKTEAQKTADRLAELERVNAELSTAKLRSDVAADKGVPAGLLTGATKEELEASADALIEFRGEQKPAVPSSTALSKVNGASKVEPFATSPGLGTLRAAYDNS